MKTSKIAISLEPIPVFAGELSIQNVSETRKIISISFEEWKANKELRLEILEQINNNGVRCDIPIEWFKL